MTNDELLHKWIHGELSEEEARTFAQRPEYESLVALYRQTEGLKPPAFQTEAVLTQVLQEPKTPVRRLARWIPYSIAASVLLFAVAGWLWFGRSQTVRYEMARGERQEGVLPDQSTFVLNAESSLSYDAKAWLGERKLQLKGEAYFVVKTGQRFTVQTPNGSVEVLGTEFNVRSRGRALDVSCQSGQVRVRSTDGKIAEELRPAEALRIEGGQLTEKWTTPDEAPWVSGITRFRKIPLQKVLDELERQFNIDIDPGELDPTVSLTGSFPQQDLDVALQTALGPLGIQTRREADGRIYLYQE